MKRIGLIFILILVMCLTMVFPASAAVTNITGMELAYNTLLSYSISGYPYRACFYYHDGVEEGISVLYSATNVITKGTYFTERSFLTDGTVKTYGNYYWYENVIQYDISPWNNGKYYPINIRIGKNSNFTTLSWYSAKNYLPEISNISLGIDSNYFGYIVDPSTLQALINQAKAKQNTGYTDTSWNNLQSQIANSETLLATTGYTQSQIDNAKNALQSALNGLVLLPDTSALQALINQAKAKQNTSYTESSWNALQSQITNAETLLATTGYTQTQIDNAKNALQSALDNLVLLPSLPDISELEALLIEADAIENTGYTTQSWSRFTTARSSAHVLASSADYSQSEVTYITNELRASMNALTLNSVTPPNPPSSSLGYDLESGDISGYLNPVPKIFYNYTVPVIPIAIGLFAILFSIKLIPHILDKIINILRR